MSEFVNTIDLQGDQETLDALVSDTQTEYRDNGSFALCDHAFRNKTSLTAVDLPNVTSIGQYAFSGCTGLTSIDFSASNAITINANAFNGTSNLEALVIRSASLSPMSNVSALTDTRIKWGHGWIFVPSDLVATYKAATNWSTYKNQIWSLDYYPITDGDYGTIRDSWEEIFSNEANGTYSTKYTVGDTKMLDYNGAKVLARIVAFDSDVLSDNSGNAKITWIITEGLVAHRMNSTKSNANGWLNWEGRTYVRDTCYSYLPTIVQNNIKEVVKTYYDKTTNSTLSCNDTVWVPSIRELGSTTNSYSHENSGVTYTNYFSSNAKRIIPAINTSTACKYWTRTANSGNATGCRFIAVDGGASTAANINETSYYITLGFCT